MVFGPDSNLYVCSIGNDRVLRYNGQMGTFIDIFASGGGLSNPDSLAFGPDGNLYVTSFLTDNVKRYNGQSGVFIDTFTVGGGLDGPVSLTFIPEPATLSLLFLGGIAALRRRR